MFGKTHKMSRVFLSASKIAIGSCIAIFAAEFWGFENASSAGTIALLTLVTTKRETIKLSGIRILAFILTTGLCFGISYFVQSRWIVYGLFLFLMVTLCSFLGWKATISVNSVIGLHFVFSGVFTVAYIENEFALVLIGIVTAIVLNLFQTNQSHEKELVLHMREAEKSLRLILGELTAYLSKNEMQRDVWDNIITLENQLKDYISEACHYQENTFLTHTEYYSQYFEMRLQQCSILHNLHYEMKRIRAIPEQANLVRTYILYLTDYVTENNIPAEQIEKLHDIFEQMKSDALPTTREEFENRAILYHVLMDLEDFLIFKKRFVENLDNEQKERYWMNIKAE